MFLFSEAFLETTVYILIVKTVLFLFAGFCGSDHCPITMEIQAASKEVVKIECIQSRQVDSLDT
jgi:hypothetical protein